MTSQQTAREPIRGRRSASQPENLLYNGRPPAAIRARRRAPARSAKQSQSRRMVDDSSHPNSAVLSARGRRSSVVGSCLRGGGWRLRSSPITRPALAPAAACRVGNALVGSAPSHRRSSPSPRSFQPGSRQSPDSPTSTPRAESPSRERARRDRKGDEGDVGIVLRASCAGTAGALVVSAQRESFEERGGVSVPNEPGARVVARNRWREGCQSGCAWFVSSGRCGAVVWSRVAGASGVTGAPAAWLGRVSVVEG